MSDITESVEPDASLGGPSRAARTTAASVAPAYRASASLQALEELVELAGHTSQDIARNAGLSVSELHSLRHLAARPMGPVELAKALGVTSAASSGVVDRLVARGHAERHHHPGDRRRTSVVVTESGRREVFALLAPMFTKLAEIDAPLTDEERVVVERYLRGAIAALRSVT
ncbi:MAG: MarR family transcriptional regulator [Knoellia sp.]